MCSQQPLVSIITVTHNRAHLIHRAIESIRKQTYRNYEHIIVDGASDDDTKRVVAAYDDPRIRFIGLAENDVSTSLETGFQISKGDFITFLDDDDEYLPAKIEKQLALIQTLPEEYGFVYCWMDYFNHVTGEFIKHHVPSLRGDASEAAIDGHPVESGTPTMFFRRSAYEQLGGFRRDIGLPFSDWEMVARACQKWKTDFVPEALVKVYINHGCIRMSDPSRYNMETARRLLTFHRAFLDEFSAVFDKHPSRRAEHLYNIMLAEFVLRRKKACLRSYCRLIAAKPSLKNLLAPVNCLVRYGKCR